uniref:DDE_3 domain-containing protein n=1 Tax=Caenorhabditis japonica TaxID=281687 RepID=A0A8R1HUB3_CAEJA
MELQLIATTENSSSYIQSLQKAIVPFFRNRRRSHVFQQDTTSIHTSKEALGWLASKGINALDWPAYSPGLNPIENLWGILARRVYKNETQYNTVQDLKAALLQEWNAISVAELQNLVASMPKQMFKVIQNHGGETSY